MASNKSYLVIGGGGFLGRWIVDQLLERNEKKIRVFDLRKTFEDSRIEYVVGDLSKIDDVLNACKDITTVIHTATASPGAPRNILEKVNVLGTKNVLEACEKCGVKQLIYTSSASVVFEGRDLKYVNETVPYCKSIDPYNETKAQAERMVLEANGKKGFMTVALRPSGLFGPRDNMATPRMLQVGLSKKSRFAQIGDNSNLFDYTYIENVAHSHILAADKLTTGSSIGGQAYFITNDEPVPFWDFPKFLWKEFDCPLPVIYLPQAIMYWIFFILDFIFKLLFPILKKDPMFMQIVINTTTTKTFSIDKAKKDLGYKPIVPLKEGMKRTADWYKKEIKEGRIKW